MTGTGAAAQRNSEAFPETDGGAPHGELDRVLAGLREHGRLPDGADPAVLKGAQLIGMDLSNLDLSGLDLSGADLSRANLSGSRLVRTCLRDAVLFEAYLMRAELLSADLTGADMSSSRADHAGFESADLSNETLFNASLEGATFTRSVLRGADLRATNLHKARLREVDLMDADFSRSNLQQADLEGSNVGGATFVDADMHNTRLRGLTGYVSANWIGADISGINFTGAYLIRRTVMDQNFLHEFRSQSRANAVIYKVWWLTSDCGRSFVRWGACILVLVTVFAGLYNLVAIDYGEYPTLLSSFYFSVVTLTTLGYGEVVPASAAAQLLAMIEVIIGYVMLGGLLSIFANKMARRAD